MIVDAIITIKGMDYDIGDDEVILPDDEKGSTKVDKEGRLLGGQSQFSGKSWISSS